MRTITFITGSAGTGKTTRLRQLLAEETRPHLIVAPTAIAAINAGGATVHRTFSIHADTGIVRKVWPMIEVVYVDEVSMLGMRLFESLIRGAPNANFVFVGDMAQLPPVKDKCWFESAEIANFTINLNRLTINHRAAGDERFATKLEMIRLGVASKQDMRWLYSQSTLEDENQNAIYLAYRNDTVRAINAETLSRIKGDLFEIPAVYNGYMREGDCNAEPILYLKEGSQVVFIVNHREHKYINGLRGVVKSVNKDNVIIEHSTGTIVVEPHNWQMKVPQELTDIRRRELEYELKITPYEEKQRMIQHYLQSGIEYIVIGGCKQYPFKLAYAMTVHKAQGLTLGPVNIDLSGFAGTHGIGYVALSRATSIDDVTFSRPPRLTDFKFRKELSLWL